MHPAGIPELLRGCGHVTHPPIMVDKYNKNGGGGGGGGGSFA